MTKLTGQHVEQQKKFFSARQEFNFGGSEVSSISVEPTALADQNGSLEPSEGSIQISFQPETSYSRRLDIRNALFAIPGISPDDQKSTPGWYTQQWFSMRTEDHVITKGLVFQVLGSLCQFGAIAPAHVRSAADHMNIPVALAVTAKPRLPGAAP